MTLDKIDCDNLRAKAEQVAMLFDKLQAEAQAVVEELPTDSALQQKALEIKEMAEALSDGDTVYDEIVDEDEAELFIG